MSWTLRAIVLVASLAAAAVAVNAGEYYTVAMANDGSAVQSTAAIAAMGPGFTATVTDAAGGSSSVAVPSGGTGLFTMTTSLPSGSGITTDGVYKVDTGLAMAHVVQFSPLEDVDSNGASSLRSYLQLGLLYNIQTYAEPGDEAALPPLPQVPGVDIDLSLNGDGSTLAVVATAANTVVALVPSVDTVAGGAVPAMNAGATYTFTLNAMEALHVRSLYDLTGTVVQSTLPVAVFAGAPCTAAGDSACDHLQEQQIPLSAAPSVYVLCSTAPLRSGTGGVPEFVRVTATATGTTTVTVQPLGTTLTLNGVGDWAQLDMSQNLVLTGSQDILVSQVWANSDITDGDPAMVTPHGFPWGATSHSMYAPTGWEHQALSLATIAGNPVSVNGVQVPPSAFSSIPGTPYSCALQEVTAGTHHVTTNLDVGVTMFGWGNAGAYWYASNCIGFGLVPPLPPLPPTPPLPTPPLPPPDDGTIIVDIPVDLDLPEVEIDLGLQDVLAAVPDLDDDGIADDQDNCPGLANALQLDTNRNGVGDACEILDALDDAQSTSPAAPGTQDRDRDGISDGADNCRFDSNVSQADLDGDGRGDLCDRDADGDAIADAAPAGFVVDNCVGTYNPLQADADQDGRGDACDSEGLEGLAAPAHDIEPTSRPTVSESGGLSTTSLAILGGIGFVALLPVAALVARRWAR